MTIQMEQKSNYANAKNIPIQMKQQSFAENVPKFLSLKLDKVEPIPPKMLRIPAQNLENKKINLLSNPIHIPKLVDLRVVLKKPADDKINHIPKLLTLPNIDGKIKFVEIQPSKHVINLDHMLKQKELIKVQDVPIYKAINLRPSTNTMMATNKPLKLLNYPEVQVKNKGLKEKKFSNQSEFNNQDESLCDDEVLKLKPKKQSDKETSEKETSDNDNEDKLYKALSNLILRRKKRKKIRKHNVRLIDIIDNIPLSSESEEENTFPNKLHSCNCLVKASETVQNINISEKNFHNTLQKDNPLAEIQNNHFSKFLDPSDDPFSWLNIIRAARLDTKHTQTEKILSNMSFFTKECQTELKEMIEIPRTITFLEQSNSFQNVITDVTAISKEVTETNVEKVDLIKIETHVEKNEDAQVDALKVVAKDLPLSENDSSSLHSNQKVVTEKVDFTQLYNPILNSQEEEKCQSMQSIPLRSSDTHKCRASKNSMEMLSKTDERTLLKENLSGFSLNLKALEDLHHNLESELHKTKLYSTDTSQPKHQYVKTHQHQLHNINISHDQCSSDLQDDDLNVICKIKDQNDDVKQSLKTSRPIHSSDSIHYSKKSQFMFGDFKKFKKEKFHLSDNQFSKSYEDENIINYEGEFVNVKENNDLESERIKQDELFKEEIRKKVRKKFSSNFQETSPSEEKSVERTKLLAWMKTRQDEKLTDYMIQLEKQHSTEHKPYVKNVSPNETYKNTYMVAEKTRNIFEDNNAERMLAGEKLAQAVLSSKLNTKTNDATKQKLNSNRKSTKIPVRDTHSSRLRKNALLIDVINLKKIKNEKFVKKPLQVKKANLLEEKTQKLSGSSPRLADPQVFITKKSYELYKAKSAKQHLERSVNSLYNNKNTNDSLLDAFKYVSPRQTDQMPTFHKKSIEKTTFKYPVDASNETIQLLAEAEMALLDEKEPAQSELSVKLPESIDWNEIEKILNTP
ncbi:myosin-11 isoform X4 [Hydra vulgaris]|uniref:Myosin-11 isoform X4 n=1 Tax=Hydra vulgaris TaxID=6087 RepID=A0ABM4C6Q6_HYDVU